MLLHFTVRVARTLDYVIHIQVAVRASQACPNALKSIPPEVDYSTAL
jgi:hypothetical protein